MVLFLWLMDLAKFPTDLDPTALSLMAQFQHMAQFQLMALALTAQFQHMAQLMVQLQVPQATVDLRQHLREDQSFIGSQSRHRS